MEIPSSDSRIRWLGRVYKDANNHSSLISSGSSMKFILKGEQGKIWLRDDSPAGEYNYISIEVNGKHFGRTIIRNKEFSPLDIPLTDQASIHEVTLYKETEASCGPVVISHLEVEDLEIPVKDKRLGIEFIGNSITAGMASDPSIFPCETNKWYDQHNAYLAYGPRAARLLQMDYMVVAVSGIGVYRNWNTNFPVIGDLYEKTFLTSADNDPVWGFEKFIPDYVCINLGTNDFSDGDGINERAAVDSALFIRKYVDLIITIAGKYPSAQLILLQMKWPGQSYEAMFTSCLKSIINQSQNKLHILKPIQHFTFSSLMPTGCTGHPGLKEHEQMARELADFIENDFLSKSSSTD